MASASKGASSGAKTHGGYAEAIAALNTLQSNAAIIEAIRKSGGKLNDFALPEMVEYLERIGWTQDDLNRLNVIHITGTKGKGSTSAFVDSIVRTTAKSTQPSNTSEGKGPIVGLYTSPHLVQVRERIRLDGIPVSEELFAKYFWEVWDKLEANPKRNHPDMTPLRPVYFRYLTILAYHIFLTLGVKCTILEVGIGGKYDSTNVVRRPVVTGITTLGLDHTALLGNTIEEIAVQKAGIYKQGCPAVSVWQQAEGARRIIAEEADRVKASPFKQLPEIARDSPYRTIRLGIPGAHQASNAQLAVEMVRELTQAEAGRNLFGETTPSTGQKVAVTEVEEQGLRDARWPGRCQVVRGKPSGSDACCWFLDGAHTTESLESCAQWFVGASKLESDDGSRPRRTLVFNTTHDRKSEELLRGMIDAIGRKVGSSGNDSRFFFDEIIFCTNITYREGKSSGDLTAVAGPVSLEPQQAMQRAWQAVDAEGKTTTRVLASIEEAVEAARSTSPSTGARHNSAPHHVLVCGSLHLVGGVMNHLKDAGLLDEALHGRY